MRTYKPQRTLAPVTESVYRVFFWAPFLSAYTRRESIAARLHDLLRLADAGPDSLTPRQTERIYPRVREFLCDLLAVPAYAPLYQRVAARLLDFSRQAQEQAQEYAMRGRSEHALRARAVVDYIYEHECPKQKGSQRPDYDHPSFAKSKRHAERTLNREFSDLTAEERLFALAAFLPYQSTYGRYREAWNRIGADPARWAERRSDSVAR